MRTGFWTKTAFFILLIFLASCENDPADIRRWVNTMETAVEEATDVEILYSDSAIVRVKILAPRLINHVKKNDTKREFPDGVDVQFFDRNKSLQSTLTSKYAIQHENEKIVIARDSVVLKGSEGQQLESEELIWNETEKKIYTRKFAVLKTAEEVIWGFDFEANQDFTFARIKKVQGRLPAIQGIEQSSE